ncbi:MAG: hypothetical protein LBG52_09380 [Candidatus Peribacteria bacterium]|jgi:plasmid maintenance system antidote protein VapI|nr:hypothetical protein [Candidatus Peribacteria bacterium]
MTNLTIDENIISHTSHPGKLVEREIEARNWTQKYFAELMGVTTADVNNLIK